MLVLTVFTWLDDVVFYPHPPCVLMNCSIWFGMYSKPEMPRGHMPEYLQSKMNCSPQKLFFILSK